MNANKIEALCLDTEVSLFWNLPDSADDETVYLVSLNDSDPEETVHTYIDFKDLEPDRDYRACVSVRAKDGMPVVIGNCAFHTMPSIRIVDVTTSPYNAVGDGKTLNTQALQDAINACGKGGTVYIPSGTYLTGALDLHAHMQLVLAAGARLVGSTDPKDYLPLIPSRFEGIERMCFRSLLNLGTLDHTRNAEEMDVVIRGVGKNHSEMYQGYPGVLRRQDSSGLTREQVLASLPEDASAIIGGGMELANAEGAEEEKHLDETEPGWRDHAGEYETAKTVPFRARGRLINISSCSHVRITGLTLGYAPAWNIHFIYSDHIVTDHCFIRSDYTWNGDGWDPDSSQDCTLFACDFYTGDDMVAVKSGKNPEGNAIAIPTKNIRIFNCRSLYGNGIVIGTEMSGGVEGVYVWDCDMENSDKGFEIKSTKKRGAYVRDIEVSNIRAGRILIHAVGYNDDGKGAMHPPLISDCSFRNLELTAVYLDDTHIVIASPAVLISGFDETGYEIQNISMDHIRIGTKTAVTKGAADGIAVDTYEQADADASGRQLMIMKHCRNVSMNHIDVL